MSHIPSTDTRDVVTERALPQWLISRVPAILEQYHEESRQQYGPHATDDDVSAYFLLSFVLKPHLELLMEAGDETELQRIFDLLEYLANHGDPSVQNELRVTIAEVDLWKVGSTWAQG